MAIDLKSMSRKELEKLLTDVKKALHNAQAKERREARKAAEKAVAEFGLSLEDITEVQKKPRKARKTGPKGPKTKSKPKFANPNDKSQTWTGKGRQPNWYRAEIEKGTKPESMAV
ncbi:MAG: H-NS histone family protein [Sulfitobacter sp.]|nr:H-NS histone family protein [Sulfitobacter sp.]